MSTEIHRERKCYHCEKPFKTECWLIIQNHAICCLCNTCDDELHPFEQLTHYARFLREKEPQMTIKISWQEVFHKVLVRHRIDRMYIQKDEADAILKPTDKWKRTGIWESKEGT